MPRFARNTHVSYVDEEGNLINVKYQAGEEPAPEHLAHINNPRCFLGEDEHSPGNDPDPDDINDPLADAKDGLQKLSVAQLVRLANDKGISFPASPRKRDLVTLLREQGVKNPYGTAD